MALTRTELDALPLPPKRPSRCRRLLNLWPIVVAVLFVVAVLASAIAGFSSLFTLHYRNVIAIGEGSCVVDDSSDSAWVTVPMQADSYGVNWRVERVVGGDATVLGLATLAQDQTIESLDADQRDDLREQLQLPPDNEWVRVTDTSIIAVLAFERTTDDVEVTVKEVVLWWSHGEPAGLQRVALNLEWSGDECSASTHDLPEVEPTLDP